MTYPTDPAERQPKGDHNRRMALGLEVEALATEAGVSAEDLRAYEKSGPDDDFDLTIAEQVGAALERLEANPPASQKIKT